jgi:hypothetical protein
VKRVNPEEAALREKLAEERRITGRRGMAFYGEEVVVGAVDPNGPIPVAPMSHSRLLTTGSSLCQYETN